MLPLEPFVVGLLGAFATETLKIYQFYHEWPLSKFKSLVRSKYYRWLAMLMILVSGIVASAFSLKTGQDAFVAFAHGAAAGPLLRTLLKTAASEKPMTFGPGADASFKDLL